MFTTGITRRQGLGALLSLGLGMAVATNASAQAKYKWDLTVYLPLSTPAVQMLDQFADDVKANTKGEVEITVRPAGELPYAVSEYHRAVGSGQIAMADTSFLTADVPAAGALTLPFIIRDYDEMEKAMNAVWGELNTELGKYGCEALFWSAYAPIVLWGAKSPVKQVSDISGMKIRALTAENSELLTALNAVPVTLATPEVMTALQYGTVDAVLTSPYGMEANKWGSAFKWGFSLDVAMTPTYVLVNKQMMAELPQAHQDAIRGLAKEYQSKWLALARDIEGKSLADIKARGTEVAAPTEQERAQLTDLAQPIWTKWAENRGGNTPEILDAVRKSVGR